MNLQILIEHRESIRRLKVQLQSIAVHRRAVIDEHILEYNRRFDEWEAGKQRIIAARSRSKELVQIHRTASLRSRTSPFPHGARPQ